MLLMLIKEYEGICNYLMTHDYIQFRGYILVEKKQLCALLDKNNYELADNKLRFWKQLHWIQSEPGRLTCRVQGKRMIKISIEVFETIKRLNQGGQNYNR